MLPGNAAVNPTRVAGGTERGCKHLDPHAYAAYHTRIRDGELSRANVVKEYGEHVGEQMKNETSYANVYTYYKPAHRRFRRPHMKII
jgi:hypothetical protein